MDGLRNFKDFLLLFNTMSETCFTRCVNTFQTRELTEDEDRCVELCSTKNIRVNHKVMSVYMEVQPLILEKRMEEMMKLNPPTTDTNSQPTDTSDLTKTETITDPAPQVISADSLPLAAEPQLQAAS